jgi:hypothetical protein
MKAKMTFEQFVKAFLTSTFAQGITRRVTHKEIREEMNSWELPDATVKIRALLDFAKSCDDGSVPIEPV